jgi:hypothetical protein
MKILRLGVEIEVKEEDAKALVENFPETYSYIPEDAENVPDKKKKGK